MEISIVGPRMTEKVNIRRVFSMHVKHVYIMAISIVGPRMTEKVNCRVFNAFQAIGVRTL